MKEKLNPCSVKEEQEHSVLEMEEISFADSSITPMNSSYPCSQCGCQNFEMSPLASIICKCGHDSKAHGLP